MRWLVLLLCLAFAVPQADAAARKKAKRPAAAAKKPAAAGEKAGSAAKKTRKSRTSKRGDAAAQAPDVAADMDRRWNELQQTLKPAAALNLCADFERDFPGSPHGAAIGEIRAAAQRALAAQRAARLASDALEEPEGDADYRIALAKALRGDADAAYLIAGMYRDGSHGLPLQSRRHEQWLHFAAELGSAAAGWQLAEVLNRAGQWSDAARYEQRAIDAGFSLPARLPSRTREY